MLLQNLCDYLDFTLRFTSSSAEILCFHSGLLVTYSTQQSTENVDGTINSVYICENTGFQIRTYLIIMLIN